MTPQEIREAKEQAYVQINNGENVLKHIRAICPHENTSQGLYSWRVGNIQEAEICDDCGTCIKFLEE